MSLQRLSLLPWLCSAILFVGPCCPIGQAQGYRPPGGFIPDEKTAIRVAEAVLSPIFGEEKIQNERPFTATLKDEVWSVTGHLNEAFYGGVAEIRISKTDGRILSVGHGK